MSPRPLPIDAYGMCNNLLMYVCYAWVDHVGVFVSTVSRKARSATGKSRCTTRTSSSKARSCSKARPAFKARYSTSRVRGLTCKFVRARSASARRSTSYRARGATAAKATGRSASTRTRAAGAGSSKAAKSGVRSRSSSAAGRSQSRASVSRVASTGKTSSKGRGVLSAKKEKGRLNCYTAYLKAQLATRKITKVR